MSNVKPGDFARLVSTVNPDNPNIGKICVVLRRSEYYTIRKPNQLRWDIQPLELWARKVRLTGELRWTMEVSSCADEYLRRIDPPADSEWLWRDCPLEHDLETRHEVAKKDLQNA